MCEQDERGKSVRVYVFVYFGKNCFKKKVLEGRLRQADFEVAPCLCQMSLSVGLSTTTQDSSSKQYDDPDESR